MRPSRDQNEPSETARRELLNHVMRREWHMVVETYKQKKLAHTTTINRSGDTALHMAISDGQPTAVKLLVQIVGGEALRIGNEQGNTALHIAAYLGSAKMCSWIAQRDPHLIGLRNNLGQTPIFLAVVHGRRDAFLSMYRFIRARPDRGYALCSSDDGRTILHSAISGEHFDLAIQIVELYPKLNRNDVHGITPLHLLATKPSAFKSGTRFGFLQSVLYHCIYIRKLQVYRDKDDANNTWPFSGFIRSFFGWTRKTEKDMENPNSDRPTTNDEKELSSSDTDYFYCREFGDCLSQLFEKTRTILTLGLNHQIRRIIDEKRKHKWTMQIMRQLVDATSPYEFEMEVNSYTPPRKRSGDHEGINIHDIELEDLDDVPHYSNADNNAGNGAKDGKEEVRVMVEKVKGKFEITIREREAEEKDEKKTMMKQNEKKETPMLMAAKHGIIEMVEYIVNKYPLAIHNENTEGKNIVLLAVECRQPHIYKFLLREIMTDNIFYKTDTDGNSALHVAAMLANRRNWLIPGPALQMQWEVKWYQFVENSKPAKFFVACNHKGETPWQIFDENHKDLAKEASEWLYKTSESCSVVAVLIATVAFTASATVPGGVESNGSPVLRKQPAFNVFAIASLVALCFSIASVVMFMAFFTSRHRERDYGTNLPAKLLVELTSLLISIAAVLVSFCAAHFFVIKDTFKYTAFSLYAATLFPVALYAFWQIPMYYELVKATVRTMPQRVYHHD